MIFRDKEEELVAMKRAGASSDIFPLPPDLDDPSNDVLRDFYAVNDRRQWSYVLVPIGGDTLSFKTIMRPDPLPMIEMTAWLDERDLRGQQRRSRLDALRHLDGVWISAWLETEEV